ncbi:MAG: HlyD family efflux transporter periplasmic adaptor subunit [Pseudonocardiales bacterium]|nr:HlyD family efflux transporter periplasmic adaptor subunit [Pseudonocardiales bacterium]MBV9648789.1 HlyD family efflux transporter periplasmic adaptor subunit [Pseudonocardiales bacterium]
MKPKTQGDLTVINFLTSPSTLITARCSTGRVMVSIGLVAALGLAAGCGTEPTPPPTGRVERGTVVTRVSASGSLSAIKELNVGFPKGAQLKELLVKVGDRVTPGQVVAREDDFAFRQVLNQLQGQLNAQQALLDQAINDPTAAGAHDTLEQARQVLAATEKSVQAQLQADETAVDQAHRQLDFDSFLLDKAEQALRADQASCAATGGIPATPATPGTAATPGGVARTGPGSGPRSSVGVGPTEAGVEDPARVGPVYAGTTGTGGANGSGGGAGGGNPACNRVATDQTNVVNARRTLLTDKATLTAAQQRLNVDRASGQVSIENARQSVVTAQNTLVSAATNRPFNIDQQVALVASIQAQVANAQRDVENTVLRAPVGGTVSVINGTVGEFLQPSSGVSPLAPGSTAPIPGLNGVTSNSSTSLGNPATGAARPGGTQFLVLDDVNTFQVVVPFEESDAAKVAPNQKVNVTFDAIPDLNRAGTVVSVAPSGSNISSVINYYVTVVLNEIDPRLKNGQTAQARVTTNEVDDVLTVPNSAVRKRGDQSTVTVIDAAGNQQQVRFQPGLVGDDRTQVISGLREGQQVVLRQGV